MALIPLSRGIPATVHIGDANTRRLFDAIIENLGKLKYDTDTGDVILGNAIATSTASALSLQNLGDGSPVGIAIADDKLKLRTIKGSGACTVTVAGNCLVVAGSASGADNFKVKVKSDGGDTEGWLETKLVSVGTGNAVLSYSATQGLVKSIKGEDGIIAEIDGSDIKLTVDPEYISVDDHLVYGDGIDIVPGTVAEKVVDGSFAGLPVLLQDVGFGVKILGLAAGAGMEIDDLAEAGTDLVITSLGQVRLSAEDETYDYLPSKFSDYVQALGTAGEVENCQAVVWDGGLSGVKTLQLGDSSVLDVGTVADTVAAGDHTHAEYAWPAGSEGDVLYYSGGAWVAASLIDLVHSILAAYTVLDPVTPDYHYFVRGPSPDYDLRWGPISPCEES